MPATTSEFFGSDRDDGVEGEEFRERMRRVGEAFRAAGVGAVYLVHGTFAGADALGLIRALSIALPRLQAQLQLQQKRMADAVFGEAGNFTDEYARIFEESMTPAAAGVSPIPVRRFHWSSENHHIGRADAAVRLIDELNTLMQSPSRPRRVLLWGHSHAGNVFALLTNLLAADADARKRFFAAARTFYRRPIFRLVDVPVWRRVQKLLRQPRRPIDHAKLDIVTFGTPIRCGWDAGGYAQLLHFVNHRPADGLPPYRAPFPPKAADVLHARHGDYIQQLGIAGTNAPPGVFAWRTWLADCRLGRYLQPTIRRRDLARNLACGMRAPDEGTTLLVDYCDGDGNPAEHMAGHAVYTRRKWLLFHAEEVCRRFY